MFIPKGDDILTLKISIYTPYVFYISFPKMSFPRNQDFVNKIHNKIKFLLCKEECKKKKKIHNKNIISLCILVT